VDGLIDAFHNVHMGVTAERLAKSFQITRDRQDAFALQSQQRTKAAVVDGKFVTEIQPLQVETRSGPFAVATDEQPMPDLTAEKLSRLKPAFSNDGTVTAGNSSGLNDGAAMVIVGSTSGLKMAGLQPLARIASYASAGLDPMDMGLGPVEASKLALKKAGWTIADLDLIELNEAFAAQAIAVNMIMGWSPDLINVNGGAIALGHPLAGSGARIVATLLHEMIRRNSKRGLAAMCIGGGQGVAICLER
jgi:acetyl-CoA C-acetyltransferase